MFKFEYLQGIIAVFISNAISDHDSFKIKHAIKLKFQAQIGKILSILSFNPIYPYGYKVYFCPNFRTYPRLV